MTVANQNATIHAGEDVDLPFAATDENGNPINLLTLCTAISFEWWADGEKAKGVVTKVGTPTSAQIGWKTDGSNGQFLVRLLPSDFTAFELPISGRYVVRATISAKVDTLATGILTIARSP